MACSILVRAANIEHIGGAIVVSAPALQSLGVDAGEPCGLGDARRARSGKVAGHGRYAPGKAARIRLEFEPVEQPSPRAVMQHVDVVGNPGSPEAQASQDATRRTHTVDHDLG